MRLLEVAINYGWSLGSLYYSTQESAFLCKMRRSVKPARPAVAPALLAPLRHGVPPNIRQLTEQVSATARTAAESIFLCAQSALDDSDAVLTTGK